MAADGFDSLSVPELKELLSDRGVDFSTCVEKHELLALCRPDASNETALVRSMLPGVHHDIAQNTKQWFHIRRGDHNVRVGGSEIGVILGVSLYAKPYSLWEKIIAQTDGTWENDEEESPPPCVHGNDCEPLIAGMYKHYMECELAEGGYYQHQDSDLGELYGASPDRRVLGPTGMTDYLLEIKAPYGRMYTFIKPEHMAQMQYQMWCSGLQRCDYLAVKLDPNEPERTIPSKIRVLLARVYRSDEYIAWMIPRLYYFSKCLILRKCPPRDLYESEEMGLVPAPKPRVEEVVIENGAWKLQECA